MKNRKAAPAATAQIIQLPHNDFSFEPYTFAAKALVKAYDRDRPLVEIVDSLLRLNIPAMKRKLANFPSVTTSSVGDLISDITVAGDAYEALAELFACAAARLTAVDAKLV